MATPKRVYQPLQVPPSISPEIIPDLVYEGEDEPNEVEKSLESERNEDEPSRWQHWEKLYDHHEGYDTSKKFEPWANLEKKDSERG